MQNIDLTATWNSYIAKATDENDWKPNRKLTECGHRQMVPNNML